MFPKIETNSCLRKEKIAAHIIHEDHLRTMLSKTQNMNYRPWKSKYCPKNAHSPFGDFPKNYMNKKMPKRDPQPTHEKAQSSTKYSKKQGGKNPEPN